MKAAATKVGSVFIDVRADAGKFRQDMARTKAEATAAGASISGAMDRAKHSVDGLKGAVGMLGVAMAALGGGALGKSYIDIADKFSLMRSRIRLVTQAGEDMLKIEQDLTNQALRNRADLKSTIDLYTRLRQTRSDLSDEAAQSLVDAWSKSLIISASSAQEAASSTMQFAQAMSRGALSGQEYNSVISGNLSFLNYLAQSLGVTTGELKKMGEEGKLTLEVITEGIRKAGHTIEHDFAKKALTVHQALVNVETSLTRWVGLADQGRGATAQLADWINVAAVNFDRLADALLAAAISAGTGVAIAFGIKAVKAITDMVGAMRTATTAAIKLKTVMAFMGGPWGIMITAAAVGMMEFAESSDDAKTTVEKVDDRIAAMRETIEATNEAILRDRAMKGLADDLETVANKADAVTLRIAAIRAEMERTGRAEQVRQQSALEGQNIEAWLLLEQLQTELDAQLAIQANKGKRGPKPTTLGNDAREMSPAQVDELRNRIMRLKREIADTDARIKEVMNADPGAFLPTAGNVGGSGGADPLGLLEKQMALEIARARGQEDRVRALEDEIAIMQLSAQLVEKGLKSDEARARAIAHVAALRASEVAETKELAGYTTDLEELNAELAAIEEARAKGATNTSRASMQALLDYLKSSEDVATVLGKIRDLQGGILSAADASMLGAMVTAFEDANWDDLRENVQDIFRDSLDALAGTPVEVEFIGEDFERRMSDTMANATKQGLMWGIETGDWGDVFAGILTDLVRESLSNAMDVLFQALSQIQWGQFGTGWGGFFGMIGAGFGGAPVAGGAAGGGFVSANRKYRVGELGSEWFVPKTDGFIIPNMERMTATAGALEGGASVVVGAPIINIAGNADERTIAIMRQELEAHRRALPAAIDARVKDRLQRGAY